MLSQSTTGKFLDQCKHEDGSFDVIAIEEVLSGYIAAKYLGGADSHKVLEKLRYLALFLRVTGRAGLLHAAREQYLALSVEVAIGGGRIGWLPGFSKPGIEVWNILRRKHGRVLHTVGFYGGPGSLDCISAHQRVPVNDGVRDQWVERYFHRRPTYGSLPPDYAENPRSTIVPQYVSRAPAYDQITRGSTEEAQVAAIGRALP